MGDCCGECVSMFFMYLLDIVGLYHAIFHPKTNIM